MEPFFSDVSQAGNTKGAVVCWIIVTDSENHKTAVLSSSFFVTLRGEKTQYCCSAVACAIAYLWCCWAFIWGFFFVLFIGLLYRGYCMAPAVSCLEHLLGSGSGRDKGSSPSGGRSGCAGSVHIEGSDFQERWKYLCVGVGSSGTDQILLVVPVFCHLPASHGCYKQLSRSEQTVLSFWLCNKDMCHSCWCRVQTEKLLPAAQFEKM